MTWRALGSPFVSALLPATLAAGCGHKVAPPARRAPTAATPAASAERVWPIPDMDWRTLPSAVWSPDEAWFVHQGSPPVLWNARGFPVRGLPLDERSHPKFVWRPDSKALLMVERPVGSPFRASVFDLELDRVTATFSFPYDREARVHWVDPAKLVVIDDPKQLAELVDARSGRAFRSHSTPSLTIHYMPPSSTWVAFRTPTSFGVLDLETGTRRELPGEANDFAWSTLDPELAVMTKDGSIMTWRIAEGFNKLRDGSQNEGWDRLAWTHDGSAVAPLPHKGRPTLLDARTGKTLSPRPMRLQGHPWELSVQEGAVHAAEPNTGEKRLLRPAPSYRRIEVKEAVWIDEDRVFTVSDRDLVELDLRSGKARRSASLVRGDVNGQLFWRGQEPVLAICDDQAMTFVEAFSGKEIFRSEHACGVHFWDYPLVASETPERVLVLFDLDRKKDVAGLAAEPDSGALEEYEVDLPHPDPIVEGTKGGAHAFRLQIKRFEGAGRCAWWDSRSPETIGATPWIYLGDFREQGLHATCSRTREGLAMLTNGWRSPAQNYLWSETRGCFVTNRGACAKRAVEFCEGASSVWGERAVCAPGEGDVCRLEIVVGETSRAVSLPGCEGKQPIEIDWRAWAPGGRRLVVRRGQDQFWVVDLERAAALRIPLVPDPSYQHLRTAIWNGAGMRLSITARDVVVWDARDVSTKVWGKSVARGPGMGDVQWTTDDLLWVENFDTFALFGETGVVANADWRELFVEGRPPPRDDLNPSPGGRRAVYAASKAMTSLLRRDGKRLELVMTAPAHDPAGRVASALLGADGRFAGDEEAFEAILFAEGPSLLEAEPRSGRDLRARFERPRALAEFWSPSAP